jgi:hypothetical protein
LTSAKPFGSQALGTSMATWRTGEQTVYPIPGPESAYFVASA